MNLKTVVSDIGIGIASLLFPNICLICEERISSSVLVCDECWGKLKPNSEEVIRSKNIPENLDSVYPVFEFNDEIQTIIHNMKYAGRRSLARELGRRVAWYIPAGFINSDAVLVPIPLFPVKRRERGYNQAELIAQGIAEFVDIPINTKLIKRVKNTVTQTHLDAQQRHENMQNAFAIADASMLNSIRSIVLVDDVYTTGATMNAAATVLKAADVENIKALTVAAPI